jgi:hypothetical protein
MYRLANVDFSNRLGVVVSELAAEETYPEVETSSAKPKVAGHDPAAASLADKDLEIGVFGAP